MASNSAAATQSRWPEPGSVPIPTCLDAEKAGVHSEIRVAGRGQALLGVEFRIGPQGWMVLPHSRQSSISSRSFFYDSSLDRPRVYVEMELLPD